MGRKNNYQTKSSGDSSDSEDSYTQAMDFVDAASDDWLPQPKRPRHAVSEGQQDNQAQEFVFDEDDSDILDWLASNTNASEETWLSSNVVTDDAWSSSNPSNLTTSPALSTSSVRTQASMLGNDSPLETLNTGSCGDSLAVTSLRANLSALMAGILEDINSPTKTLTQLHANRTLSMKERVHRAHLNLNLGFYADALADYQHVYQAKHGPLTQLSHENLIDGLRDLSKQAQQQRHYPQAQVLLELAYLMVVETTGHSPYCARLLSELGQLHRLNNAPITDATAALRDIKPLLTSSQPLPVGLSRSTLCAVGTATPASDHTMDRLPPFSVLLKYITAPI